MKALDKYFLMVVFTFLLDRAHMFANLMLNLNRETRQSKGKFGQINIAMNGAYNKLKVASCYVYVYLYICS